MSKELQVAEGASACSLSRDRVQNAIEILRAFRSHHVVMAAKGGYEASNRRPHTHKAESISDAVVELELWLQDNPEERCENPRNGEFGVDEVVQPRRKVL
jgi:hypothetical protein